MQRGYCARFVYYAPRQQQQRIVPIDTFMVLAQQKSRASFVPPAIFTSFKFPELHPISDAGLFRELAAACFLSGATTLTVALEFAFERQHRRLPL
jgi:hypothetical protein